MSARLKRLRRQRNRARLRGHRIRARRLTRAIRRERRRNPRPPRRPGRAPTGTPAVDPRPDVREIVGQNIGANRPLDTTPNRDAFSGVQLGRLFATGADVVMVNEAGEHARSRAGFRLVSDGRHCAIWARDGYREISRDVLRLSNAFETGGKDWGHARDLVELVLEGDDVDEAYLSAHLAPTRGNRNAEVANRKGQERLAERIRHHRDLGRDVFIVLDANKPGLIPELRSAARWTSDHVVHFGVVHATGSVVTFPEGDSDHAGFRYTDR